MAKDKDSNIFDEARKRLGGKKKKKKVSSKETPKPKEIEPVPDDDEVEEMLKKLRTMDDDLKNKVNRICELSGMSKKEVEGFIDNPHNFNDIQWSKTQAKREELEEKLLGTLGVEAKKSLTEKKKKKVDKSRKGKTLGGRKGWMPIK